MTDSLEAKHGTSEEFFDPYCDICYETKDINIKPEGYCHECYQCLCKDCLAVHTSLPATKYHVIRTEKDMPKSQKDKPPRFESFQLSSAASSPSTLSQSSAAGYQPFGKPERIKDIKAEKCAEYNIDLPDDQEDCGISGLAVTWDGRRLLTDWVNNKIKLFSRDMKIISSLSLPGRPGDISVTGDREAVVSFADKSKLYILDVSDQHLSVRRTVELSFTVLGIATCKDRLVVASPVTSPPSVKLIDHRGKVYWSRSADQQGQKLFSRPWCVICYDDGRSSTVIVTDWGNDTLTLLNSDTGEVIRRREVKGKMPYGVTTDPAGNIYAYYGRTKEVAMLTGDLSEEKILLTVLHSYYQPAIVYDTVAAKLVVIHDIEDE